MTKQYNKTNLILLTITLLGLISSAYAINHANQLDYPFAISNNSGTAVSYSYLDAAGKTQKGTLAIGAQKQQIFANAASLPSPVYLTLTDSAGKTYCAVNGDDYYHPSNKPSATVEYPTINNGWHAYTKDIDQPFVKTHTGSGGYSNMIIPLGVTKVAGNTMTINSPTQCVFDVDPVASGMVEASHSGSIIPADNTLELPLGDASTVDMATLFSDKVPGTQTNPNPDPKDPSSFVGMMVTADSLPSGVTLTPEPHATYTSWSLNVGKTLQASDSIHFHACDTNLTPENSGVDGYLYPGILGVCNSSTDHTPNPDEDAQATLNIDIVSGVFAKDPDQIVASFEKAGESKATQPLLTSDFNSTQIAIPNVDQYFTATPGSGSLTYQVVNDDQSLQDHLDGDQPWTSKLTNAGEHWGPMLLHNGAKGDSLSISDFAIDPTTHELTANLSADQKVADEIKNNGGAVIQLTIQAHAKGSSVTNTDAYETIYIVIRSNNGFTILQHHVQAWLYAPNDIAAAKEDNPNALFLNDDKGDYRVSAEHSTTCNYTTTDPGRLAHYVKTIADSWPATADSKKYGISEITPDMGWIDIDQGWGTPDKPTTTDLYAQEDPNPEVGCLASYFKYNADQSGHPLKFLVTEEFGKALGNAASTILEPWQLNAVLKDLAIDANPVAWKSYTGKGPAYYTGKNSNPDYRLVDGIQFDLEAPFPNNEPAHKMYKGIADLLAREGKTNEVYAFADGDNAALMQAQGPMGKFLLSSYDVESNTPSAPSTNKLHATAGGAGFWGNGQLSNDQQDDGTAATYAGIQHVDPTTPDAQDFACHYNSKGADQNYISNSWCSANLSDLVYGNVNRFNGDIPGANKDFEQTNEMFDGHFMLSVPTEGSATSWAYNIIFKPRAVQDALDSGKHYVVPAVPNTFIANYIPLDYTDGVPLQAGKGSLVEAIQNYIKANGYPQPGHYDVFFNKQAAASAANHAQCSWSQVQDLTKYASCDAILETHEDGAADSDFTLTAGDPADEGNLVSTDNITVDSGAAVPTDYNDLNMLFPSDNNGDTYVANEMQVLYDQANTQVSTSSYQGADQQSYALNNALRTPFDNPLHNMGVAMFAISDISVENKYMPGLMNEGTIGTLKDQAMNKTIQFPASFNGRTEQASATRNLWTITDNYMNGHTGAIQGGSNPPPPPPPHGGNVKITPIYIDDKDEGFNVTGMVSGETCTMTVSDPAGNVDSQGIALANGSANKATVTDPIAYAFSNSDEAYSYVVTCSDKADKPSGTFAHYGDKLYVCVDGAATASACKEIDTTQAIVTTLGTYKYGTHTIKSYPNDINKTNVQQAYQPSLGHTVTTVDIENATVQAALSYAEQALKQLRGLL
mgnify:CR=1 FL=1